MMECIDVEMIARIMEAIDKTFERKTKGVEAPFFWIKEGKHELLDVSRNAYNSYINALLKITLEIVQGSRGL